MRNIISLKAIAMIFSITLFCACASHKNVKELKYEYSKINTYGAFGNNIDFKVNPLVCDLEVGGKVTGTFDGTKNDSREFVMGMAERDAVKKANADLLVLPDYVVLHNDTAYTVTVTGYAATYKNFRNEPPCKPCGKIGCSMVKCDKKSIKDNKKVTQTAKKNLKKQLKQEKKAAKKRK